MKELEFKPKRELKFSRAKVRALTFVKPIRATEPDKYPTGHYRNFTARFFAKNLYKLRKKVQWNIEFIDGICDDDTTTEAQKLALRKIRRYFADALRSLPELAPPKDEE